MVAKREEGEQTDAWGPLPASPEKKPRCSAAQTAHGGCLGARTPAANSRQEGSSCQVPSGCRDISLLNQACFKQASMKRLIKMGHFSR